MFTNDAHCKGVDRAGKVAPCDGTIMWVEECVGEGTMEEAVR